MVAVMVHTLRSNYFIYSVWEQKKEMPHTWNQNLYWYIKVYLDYTCVYKNITVV